MPEKFKFTKKVLQEITPQEKRKRYYDQMLLVWFAMLHLRAKKYFEFTKG